MKLTKAKVLWGCLFIAITLVINHFYHQNELDENGVYAKAKVIELTESWIQSTRVSKHKSVWFEFQVEGQEIRKRIKTQGQEFQIGDCYWIYYSKKDPSVSTVLTDKKINCD